MKTISKTGKDNQTKFKKYESKNRNEEEREKTSFACEETDAVTDRNANAADECEDDVSEEDESKNDTADDSSIAKSNVFCRFPF